MEEIIKITASSMLLGFSIYLFIDSGKNLKNARLSLLRTLQFQYLRGNIEMDYVYKAMDMPKKKTKKLMAEIGW